MRDTELAGVGEHSGVDLIFGAYDQVNQAQCRAHRHPKCACIVPLVRAEVDVQRHWYPGLPCCLGSEERSTTARLLAQTRPADQEHLAPGDGCGQYIVDGERDIRAVVAIIGERKAIWRLDAQYDRAGTPPNFGRDIARLHPLAPQ